MEIENQFRAAYEQNVGAKYAAAVAELDTKYVGGAGKGQAAGEANLRSSQRRADAPSFRSDRSGFRCVLEVGMGS